MITTIQSLNVNPYKHLFTSSSGGGNKLFVPVRPAMVVHAQFDHVAGIPAKKNQGGVSISKIKILNTLIDQLISLKQKPETPSVAGMSDEKVDVLINNYQSKLHLALNNSPANQFLMPGAAPQTGALFSIDA